MSKVLTFVVGVALLAWAMPAAAQCSAFMLAALDEDHQTFDVSVWTNSPHCPASGTIHIEAMPPGMIEFEGGNPWWVQSFFDVFTTPHTVKPEAIPIGPPDSFFDVFTHVTFDDPAYPSLMYVEHVKINMLHRLEVVRPTPCMGMVPGIMEPTNSYCFHVCHRVYTIPLLVPASAGRPIIRVVPGCNLPCNDPMCLPGDLNNCRWEVYQLGGQWFLEFEYSDPSQEPRCYCVTYEGNLPLGYEVNTLTVMNKETQTLDVTVWTDSPAHTACGTMEVFSYPPGAYISIPAQNFMVSSEPRTWHIPVAGGSLPMGSTLMLGAHFIFGGGPMCPAAPEQWDAEYAIYSTQKGLRSIAPDVSCDPSAHVPQFLMPGVPECMIVCHDVYYIPLILAGPGVPSVHVQEGCQPAVTSCANSTCSPGLPGEYRYDVIRVGGTWFLEFEHSNPQHAPACYCVTMTEAPRPREPYILCALDTARQTLNVSLWSSDCESPWNGHFTVTTNPPGELDPDAWVESFFDVFCIPRTWEFPLQPDASVLPGENFQILVECDFFGPGSDPFDGLIYTESVMMTENGLIAWHPEPPCAGDNVPAYMTPGQSHCFTVCHRIYETVLYYGEGGGRPVIHVTPGCFGPPRDSCTAEACVPGGPNDFVYEVYHNGVDWILRFEYSNPYIEPVCYCVTYAGNVPHDCETRELAALDEGHQQFQVSLRTHSNEGHLCPASGHISIFSNPPGALIGGYPDSFFDVFTEWYTVEAPVAPGSFTAGETFQMIAYVDYQDPEYPDKWLTEEVVVSPSGEHLWINDVGGECAAGGWDNVPPSMAPGQSECFRVCHRVYHIPLDAFDPTDTPTVTITPGCFGPPMDLCRPEPACTPGGPFDYCYRVWWAGDHWELEFEYSNENIEPVCYCVSVAAAQHPCETHALVALDAENQLLKVSLMSLDPAGVGPCNVSGTITLSAVPTPLYFENPSWSFSGVGETWVTWGKPSAPEPYNPIIVDTIIVEIDFDNPAQPDIIETEIVGMDLTSGGLVIHDAGGECAAGGGPNVPDELLPGQPECLIVCHDIYYIPLNVPEHHIPQMTVYSGCGLGTPCASLVPCAPGGPYSYRYNVFRVGGSWMLEFEYSNKNIEPVCYCVEISSLTGVPCEAYLLAALDEQQQEFDVTLWTSPFGPLTDGILTVTTAPGQIVTMPFSGLGSEYQTWEFPVSPGALTEGQTFQLAVDAMFHGPIYQPLHYEETVIVTAAGTLARWDPITPCTGDLVPAAMMNNTAECVVVCHRIYDILIAGPPTALPPQISITPGCFGPPRSLCPPLIPCRPGGLMDYCYRFWFDGMNWHLIFEYSNPYKEPVCYCVKLGCWPVRDLVIKWPEDASGNVQLAWTCPQWGLYTVYSTTNPNNDSNPPGSDWITEAHIMGNAGDVVVVVPPTGSSALYRNYVVKCECNPPVRK